jgi:hypothetical protein
MTIGDIETIVSPSEIWIGKFKFAPAEADKLTNLISIARSMQTMKTLPGNIGDPPFEIIFQEDGTFRLRREASGWDGTDSVLFKLSIADAVVRGIQEAVKVSVDIKLLEPQPRYTGQVGKEAPDIFEGRN